MRPFGFKPVEAADFIRAVIGAVARTDTAVIDLGVEPFRIMIGRIHRADRLARSIATVLAQHRRETRFRRTLFS